ncbi:carboxypeptidase regulatory-like domain-containing protein [Natrarchaeobius sp. A-rgal3]|uniref:GLUG motif-containing protein n=1 Tax=Natrarchaeobius versutus TaxID=1679078 RepID=UPI00350ED173
MIALLVVLFAGAATADGPAGMEGEGTASDPYEVTNVTQLQAMNEEKDAHYVLTEDINASETSDWNGGDGFEPIGVSLDWFEGTFDGNGHTISNLEIDREGEDNVGLFGLAADATIENVGVVDADVTGGENVGGLIGANVGEVSDSYATGDVSGDQNVGGLVGHSEESVMGNNVEITGSYATASVTGDYYAGGLVGRNAVEIVDSHATGIVSGKQSAGQIGGLVGRNDGTVSGSYATGPVTGNQYVGGLTGRNDGTVSSSYSTGDVTGDMRYVGGFVGRNDGTISESYTTGGVTGSTVYQWGGFGGDNDGTITGSYWNTETSGTNTGIGEDDDTGVTGLETDQMQGFAPLETMDAIFDGSGTWTIAEGYPVLARQDVDEPVVDAIDAANAQTQAGEGATLEVTAESDGTSAGMGVAVTVVDGGGLDGLDADETAVTDGNGTATFAFNDTGAGEYDLEFAWDENDDVTDSAGVTIEPASVDTVDLSPDHGGTIEAGETLEFSATATDEYGNVVADETDVTWENASQDGAFEETSAGSYDVRAERDGVTSETVTMTVEPSDADSIALSPSDARSVEANETLEFEAAAVDAYGNVVEDDDDAFTWEYAASDGTFTETDAGSYDVTAALGGVTSTITTVTVEPASVDSVVLSPSETRSLEAGERLEFDAIASDEYDNPITVDSADFTWENASQDGTFEETSPGTYDVTATYGGSTSDSVTLEVSTATVDSIDISTADGTEVTAGETVEFDAAAFDEYENLVTEGTDEFEWKNADGGRFENATAGSYEVSAVYENVTSSVTTVTVEPAETDSVVVSTADETAITAGETVEFDAVASDEYGNAITDEASEFAWIATEGGTFDRTTPGSYEVSAAYEGIDSNAITVDVSPAVVDSVEVSTADETIIDAGQTPEFTATATDQYGNLVTDGVAEFTWENAGDDGTFEGTSAGSYDVTAEFGGVTSEAVTVTVEAGNVDSIEITPRENRAIEAGETLDFDATAVDAYGNVVEDDDDAFAWEYAASDGSFTETEAGSYDVRAGLAGVTSETVTVSVGSNDIDSVSLTPTENQTIEAGETFEFDAIAVDGYGNVVEDDDEAFTWNGTPSDGTFAETGTGSYDVTAELGGISSETVTVTVEAGAVTAIEIRSEENRTAEAGEIVELRAVATDAYGNVVEDGDEAFTWQNATNGTVGKTSAGSYDVTAERDDIRSETVTVTVEPSAVDSIELVPRENQTVETDESIDFDATAVDRYGNVVEDDDAEFTWENATDDGSFANSTEGTYAVFATLDETSSATRIVTVRRSSTSSSSASPLPTPPRSVNDPAEIEIIDAESHWTGPIDDERIDRVRIVVENVGGSDGDDDVELVIDGATVAATSIVDLGSGENETVEFTDIDVGGFPPGEHPYTVETGDDVFEGTLEIPEPETRTLEVRIVDAGNSSPIPEADVTVDGESLPTDADGSAVEGLERGTYVVNAAAPGYEDAEERVTIDGDDRELRIALEPSSSAGDDDVPGFGVFAVLAVLTALLVFGARRGDR